MIPLSKSQFKVGDLVKCCVSGHDDLVDNIGVVVQLEVFNVNFKALWRPIVNFGDHRNLACFPESLELIQSSS